MSNVAVFKRVYSLPEPFKNSMNVPDGCVDVDSSHFSLRIYIIPRQQSVLLVVVVCCRSAV